MTETVRDSLPSLFLDLGGQIVEWAPQSYLEDRTEASAAVVPCLGGATTDCCGDGTCSTSGAYLESYASCPADCGSTSDGSVRAFCYAFLADDSHNALGASFMMNRYVVFDRERSQITMANANCPDPGSRTSNTEAAADVAQDAGSVSTVVWIAIGAGGGALCLLIFGGGYYCHRRRKKAMKFTLNASFS
jgi:hypothetical protein